MNVNEDVDSDMEGVSHVFTVSSAAKYDAYPAYILSFCSALRLCSVNIVLCPPVLYLAVAIRVLGEVAHCLMKCYLCMRTLRFVKLRPTRFHMKSTASYMWVPM